MRLRMLANPIRAAHIGRPVFATNASGVKVWSATYTPFAGIHTSTGTLPANRFPGQWFQSESGLHQNWMRDYDPTTGRYLQPDPLGLVDGASVYGYVKGNPGRWIDPRGMATEAALGLCALGGPFNPFCDAAVVVNVCKWVAIGAAVIYLGVLAEDSNQCEICTEIKGDGTLPGDTGAAEWGKRYGDGARDGKNRFHKLKQATGGSRGDDDYRVNPDTGDV